VTDMSDNYSRVVDAAREGNPTAIDAFEIDAAKRARDVVNGTIDLDAVRRCSQLASLAATNLRRIVDELEGGGIVLGRVAGPRLARRLELSIDSFELIAERDRTAIAILDGSLLSVTHPGGER
jgi:hypothetical protein